MRPELEQWVTRMQSALEALAVPPLDGGLYVPATRRVARLLAEEFAPKCVLCGGMQDLGWACSKTLVRTPKGTGEVQASWNGDRIVPDRKVSVAVDGRTWEFFESELTPEVKS